MAEPKFQTSFIPKATMVEPKAKRGGIGIFLFVSIIIFFLSVGFAAFVYLDKQLLVKEIATSQANIATNQSSFDTPTIESIVELSSRIAVGNTLLANHVAVTPVFNFLNQATLSNVQFKDFSFTGSSNANGQTVLNIEMNGTAKDFATVASQADEFGTSTWKNIITGTKISNLSVNSDGSISFLLSATVLPNLISYEQNLKSQGSQQ